MAFHDLRPSPSSATPEAADDQPTQAFRVPRVYAGLSLTQLIATALAAITATVAASYLGVAGTVIGAAVASVVSAIGTAVYSHSLHSARARVRVAVPNRRARDSQLGSEPLLPTRPLPARPPAVATPRGLGRQPQAWRAVAAGAGAAFAVILAVITGLELVAGRPVSSLINGAQGSGTSVFGSATSGNGTHPTPTVTTTVTPAVVVVTSAVTRTAPAATTTAPSPSGVPTVGSTATSGPVATGSTAPPRR